LERRLLFFWQLPEGKVDNFTFGIKLDDRFEMVEHPLLKMVISYENSDKVSRRTLDLQITIALENKNT
jgi:hypothetical protein